MYKLLRVPRDHTADLVAFERTHQRLRWTVTLQVVCTVLLVLTALILIPIGAALVEPVPRLLVRDCLEKQLGTTYCTSTMRYNAQKTKLWAYGELLMAQERSLTALSLTVSLVDGIGFLLLLVETNFAVHQTRAVCEWVAMFTLVGYSLSFMLYRDYEVEHSGITPELQGHSHEHDMEVNLLDA